MFSRLHHTRRKLFSYIRLLVIFAIVWDLFDTLLVHRNLRYASHEHRMKRSSAQIEPVRIYIASIHWNNEKILRHPWNKRVVDLVKTFGTDNVFVSVYESGSYDGSKEALLELDDSLDGIGAARNITLDGWTHADEIALAHPETEEGWIRTPRERVERRRIPYLAELRNRSLQPLRDMAQRGIHFDYVLFLNDVVFHVGFWHSVVARSEFTDMAHQVDDVLTLLNTNDGNYAAACSMDFKKPPYFYDTFALRDADGHEHASQTWPYFRSSTSRDAVKQGRPAPVSSCWNGMGTIPEPLNSGNKNR